MDYTQNASKLIGLTHKVKKEQEEILGRELHIDDVLLQMGRMEN